MSRGWAACSSLSAVAKVLPTAEKDLIARLLRDQADEFFRGGECLASGDSAYFLRLMAVELYFKLIYLLDTESIIFGHDVQEIYDLMPRNSRHAVFRLFDDAVRQKIELDEFRSWLNYLGGLFVKIRYPFDEFREMSMTEYEAKVKKFVEAPDDDLSEASIIYYIDRVTSLLHALREVVAQRFNNADVASA
jgi:hypothetical protein